MTTGRPVRCGPVSPCAGRLKGLDPVELVRVVVTCVLVAIVHEVRVVAVADGFTAAVSPVGVLVDHEVNGKNT